MAKRILVGVLAIVAVGSGVEAIRSQFDSSTSGEIVVTEAAKSFDTDLKGSEYALTYNLRNASESLLRIVGARVTCGCTQVRGLPLEIRSNESVELEVVVGVPEKPGVVEGKILLLTTCTRQPMVQLRFRGVVQ